MYIYFKYVESTNPTTVITLSGVTTADTVADTMADTGVDTEADTTVDSSPTSDTLSTILEEDTTGDSDTTVRVTTLGDITSKGANWR